MSSKTITPNDIEWLLDKVKQYDKSIKIHTIIEVVLTALDIIFCLLTFFYSSLLTTFAITSLLCGGVAGSRTILILRMKNLLNLLKVPAIIGTSYVLTRKKRSEFMLNIKLRNWIIAGINVIAVIFGVVMVFVEPSVFTDNIQAVVCGLGALLGVNVAIPCFNNAKVTQEDIANKEAKALEKQAKARVAAEQKSQKQELVDAEKQKIIAEQLAKSTVSTPTTTN